MDHPITGVYFSPTGGTRRALECLCSCWDSQIQYVELGAKHKKIHLGAQELLVMALPAYVGTIPQVPNLLEDFVEKIPRVY